MIDNQAPVFVVGVPRSGTTVFSVKLAEATGIAMSPETHFMPEVYARLKHLDVSEAKAVDRALDKFSTGRWFADLGLETESIKKEFLGCEQRDWPRLFATILRLYAVKSGASRWGEKTPGHYRYVTELLRWYPNCHIIFIMRDPRAVVASNLRAPFSPSYAWFIARRWREMWDIYQSHSADNRVSMVRYEDFVTNPDYVLSEIKCRIGVASTVHPKSMTVSGDKPQAIGWRKQHLKSAAGIVNVRSVARWQEQLSAHDKWETDLFAGPGPRGCDYELVASDGWAWLRWLQFLYRFPLQRLELAIIAARRLVSEDKRLLLKQKILLLAGSFLSRLSLLRNSAGRAIGSHCRTAANGKLARIYLEEKHSNSSSFDQIGPQSEILGLFAVALCERSFRVEFVVCTRKTFYTAKSILRAFAINKQASIVVLPLDEFNSSDSVEIYMPNQNTPVSRIATLSLTALNVNETAVQIDVANT
jgi:hypothetical protein